MSASPSIETFPTPSGTLAFGAVKLRFVRVIPGDPLRDFVPAYHFRILTADGSDVGHINFRVGDTAHVRVCAGHIGFEIHEPFRGQGYALQACRAIAPFIRSIYDAVTITCDPQITRRDGRLNGSVPVLPMRFRCRSMILIISEVREARDDTDGNHDLVTVL